MSRYLGPKIDLENLKKSVALVPVPKSKTALQASDGYVPVKLLAQAMTKQNNASQMQRRRFGRAISLDVIETALANASRGCMRMITDLARETIDTDPHLASVLAKRFGSVSCIPFELHPAQGIDLDKEKAMFYATVVREQINNLRNFSDTISRSAWALFDGRMAQELKWTNIDGPTHKKFGKVTMGVQGIDWIHPRRLSFGPHRELRITDDSQTVGGNFPAIGLSLDEDDLKENGLWRKFMQWTPQLFGEYAEREGLAPRCMYWSFFKRYSARDRMILLELFGKPWRILNVPEDSTASEEDLEAADEVIDALGSSFSARLPKGTNLDVQQPGRTAGQVHQEVIEESDKQISKLVLGQTGTTDAVPAGINNPQARVMQDEQQMILQHDAKGINEVFNYYLCDAIIEVNFGVEELKYSPKFVLRSDLPVDRNAEMTRLSSALEVGLSIVLDDAYKLAGFRKPEENEAILKKDQPPTPPLSPVPPPPRPVIIYPEGESPAVGEQQPIAETADTGPGAFDGDRGQVGSADVSKYITVNEARASQNLPPLSLPDGSPDPDGDLTMMEFEEKRSGKKKEVPAPSPSPAPAEPEEEQPEDTEEPEEDEDAEGEEEMEEEEESEEEEEEEVGLSKITAPNIGIKPKGKPGEWEIQSLIFNKDNFTEDEAKSWISDHDDYKNHGVDETESSYRFRQCDPQWFSEMRIIKITDGVSAVYGKISSKKSAATPVSDETQFVQTLAAAFHSDEIVCKLVADRAQLVFEPKIDVTAIKDHKQPSTALGSPEDVIEKGVRQLSNATKNWAKEYESAVRGLANPIEIYRALNRVYDNLELQEYGRTLERQLVHSAMLGVLDDAYEIGQLDEKLNKTEMSIHLAKPYSQQAFDAAIKIFKNKNVVTKASFNEMSAAAKIKAFTAAGINSTRMLQVIHDELAKQVASGADLTRFAKFMEERLKSAGMIASIDPSSHVLTASHIETVFRTNVLGAYNAGRQKHMTQPEVLKARPIWEFRAVQEPTRTRATHLAVHGKKLFANDPFWKTAYPPYGFNCRCRVVSKPASEFNQVIPGTMITGLPDPGFTSGTPNLL